MSFWSSLFFNNANSPIMEQLIFFHDHSMIFILSIIFFIFYFILFLFSNKFIFSYFYENHIIEMIWTLIPGFILIFIALPSLRLLYLMEESFSHSISIKIIAHQWYWSYEYSNFNKEFDSFIVPSSTLFRNLDVDNFLIIPFNLPIKLFISSADVIHAWTIPSLGVKMDAIPGRLNQMSFSSFQPGIFYGQCSEICGANHSFMPICMEISNINNFIKFINKL